MCEPSDSGYTQWLVQDLSNRIRAPCQVSYRLLVCATISNGPNAVSVGQRKLPNSDERAEQDGLDGQYESVWYATLPRSKLYVNGQIHYEAHHARTIWVMRSN